MDELPPGNPNVDYTQILPIQQKRIVAFINHFIMNTVSLLNTFAQSCESRLMEFEFKLQKVEASLLIVESQLSSISGLDNIENMTQSTKAPSNSKENSVEQIPEDLPAIVEDSPLRGTDNGVPLKAEGGPKYCEDARYARFFKMVRVGVAAEAVKLKMKSEGFDPNILDKPDAIVEDH